MVLTSQPIDIPGRVSRKDQDLVPDDIDESLLSTNPLAHSSPTSSYHDTMLFRLRAFRLAESIPDETFPTISPSSANVHPSPSLRKRSFSNDFLFKCPKLNCTKAFKSQKGLSYHMEHGSCSAETKSVSVGQHTAKPYLCPNAHCNKSYKNANGLEYHLRHGRCTEMINSQSYLEEEYPRDGSDNSRTDLYATSREVIEEIERKVYPGRISTDLSSVDDNAIPLRTTARSMSNTSSRNGRESRHSSKPSSRRSSKSPIAVSVTLHYSDSPPNTGTSNGASGPFSSTTTTPVFFSPKTYTPAASPTINTSHRQQSRQYQEELHQIVRRYAEIIKATEETSDSSSESTSDTEADKEGDREPVPRLIYPIDRLDSVLEESVDEAQTSLFPPPISIVEQKLEESTSPSEIIHFAPPDLTSQITLESDSAIGGGGYADVWRGFLSREGESRMQVAIKVIRSQIYTEQTNWKIRKRLRREIRIWGRLRHSNVIPLLGITRNLGPYESMVCPWVEGGDLNGHLEKHRFNLTLHDRLQLLNDVAKGLRYLHSESVIHGDLTSGNILINNGNACLCDFGLSTIITDFQGTSLVTSTVAGSCRWAAPELYAIENENEDDPPTVTKSCDIYSFGSVAYQIISGKMPYYNITRNEQVILEILKGRRSRRPPVVLLNDDLWIFIQHCWDTSPQHRPTIEEGSINLQNYINSCAVDILGQCLVPT